MSVGTVFQIPWTYLGQEKASHCPTDGPWSIRWQKYHAPAWPRAALEMLRKNGFLTAAMALRDDSLPVDAPVLKEADKLAIIMGREGDGLTDLTLSLCDHTVRIPMSNGVDSLNVAAASAVAFYEMRHR